MLDKVHKEYQKFDSNIRVSLYTDDTALDLSKFNELYEFAKQYFPKLKIKDVEIAVYGERNYGYSGVEFNVDATLKMPEGFHSCKLERTLV